MSCNPQGDGNVGGGGAAGGLSNKFVNMVGILGAIIIVLVVLCFVCKHDKKGDNNSSYTRASGVIEMERV